MRLRPVPLSHHSSLSLVGLRLGAIAAVGLASAVAMILPDIARPEEARPAPLAGEALVARGEYLVRIMDCGGCHTPRGPEGAPREDAPLAGGTIGFQMPGYGIVWPPNLTPDATGLGGWTDAQIDEAIRGGRRPDGRALAPVMPWPGYAGMHDEDLAAVIAFLRSLPPVGNPTPGPVEDGAPAPAPYFTVAMPK